MKILIVHNSYQQEGGEDIVQNNEAELLSSNGHTVNVLTVSNNVIEGRWSKLQTAFQTTYSLQGKKRVAQAILTHKPDVVHVHNFFPLLSPSIFEACQEAAVPSILTLHNFRILCAGALLLREGKICEDCINGTPFSAVLHGCYRGSRLGTLAVARMINFHMRKGTWEKHVDRFIALTEFGKNKFIEAGLPAKKICVKPNFSVAPSTHNHGAQKKLKGGLYIGRLSKEKGIHTMLEAWAMSDLPLRIIGDGPLREDVISSKLKNQNFMGRQGHSVISKELSTTPYLIFPSEWYETFGLTIIEAFSHAVPVIASRIGVMAEIVKDGVTGLHFTPGNADDLHAKVHWANEHPNQMLEMGRNARREYEDKYTPEKNLSQILDIYREAIESTDKNTI